MAFVVYKNNSVGSLVKRVERYICDLVFCSILQSMLIWQSAVSCILYIVIKQKNPGCLKIEFIRFFIGQHRGLQ